MRRDEMGWDEIDGEPLPNPRQGWGEARPLGPVRGCCSEVGRRLGPGLPLAADSALVAHVGLRWVRRSLFVPPAVVSARGPADEKKLPPIT